MRITILGVLLAVLPAGHQTAGSDSDRLEVQSWQAPHSGWLYVVDAAPLAPAVLLFDPGHGEVAGTIRTGFDAAIALSPRGDRLYIASQVYNCKQPNCDLLAAIDTQSGRVLSLTPIPDRIHYKVVAPPSSMIVSADGRTVYVPVWQGLPSGDTPVAVAAFDTVRERFLSGVIDLGVCGGISFVRVTDDNELGVHCTASNELLVHRLIAPDRGFVEFSVRLAWGNRLFAQHVYPDVAARSFMLSADRRRLFVVSGDGAVSDVNLTLGSVNKTSVRGNETETVMPFASPGSLDRGLLYVAVGAYDGQGLAREIRVFDTNTWVRVSTIRTRTPFRSAVGAIAGSVIYALTAEGGTVLVIDPEAQRELRTAPVGRSPSAAIVAP